MFLDYRNVYCVDTSICPKSVRDIFLGRISALLNNTSDKNLVNPVYVFFRQEDVVLYGIACLNSVLSADYCLEKTNGRVRGFFGVIMKTGELVQEVPNSLDFYTKMYEKYIIPKWTSYTFHYQKNEDIELPDDASNHIISPIAGNALNTDFNVCRLFESPKLSFGLLAEALTYRGNISLVIGITDRRQAPLNDFAVMNAMIIAEGGASYTDLPVTHSDVKPTTGSKKNIVEKPSEIECRCNKCGKKFSVLYTKEKLCEYCYKESIIRKQRKQKFVFVVACLFVIVVLAYLFAVRPKLCKVKTNSTPPTTKVAPAVKPNTVHARKIFKQKNKEVK